MELDSGCGAAASSPMQERPGSRSRRRTPAYRPARESEGLNSRCRSNARKTSAPLVVGVRQLLDSGAIPQAEYEAIKAKALV
jgi:hypothetical protein